MEEMIKGGKRKGLIIGISDYDNKLLRNLDFCKRDGQEVYEVLKSLGYEISNDNMLIAEVTGEKLRNSIT